MRGSCPVRTIGIGWPLKHSRSASTTSLAGTFTCTSIIFSMAKSPRRRYAPKWVNNSITDANAADGTNSAGATLAETVLVANIEVLAPGEVGRVLRRGPVPHVVQGLNAALLEGPHLGLLRQFLRVGIGAGAGVVAVAPDVIGLRGGLEVPIEKL